MKNTIKAEQTKTSNRVAKTYDFKDVQGVRIPNKIKCSKCGREVQGNPELIYLRVMKDYDGQWLKYQKEWVCSNCKHEATRSLKEHLQAEKKVEAVKKAKALTSGEVVKIA